MNFLKVVLSGFIIGILSGLFGLGGSSIATPILKIFANIKPAVALATPLLTVIPSSVSASYVYYKRKLVNFDIAKLTMFIGLPFVILGAYVTKFVDGKFLMVSTAIFIFAVGLSFLFRGNLFERKNVDGAGNSKLFISLIPLIGFVSGFLANGGGIMLVPLYVKVLKMEIKKAFGTSLFVISFFAIPGALVHFLLGHIDLKLFFVLSVTAVPLANLSARVAVKLKDKYLEIAYGILLVAFSIYFFFREI